MRILVDCIPFDCGKSGISVYVREVVRALAVQGHDLTLLTEAGVAAEFFPGHKAIEAPGWTRRPALCMLWHLLLLPRLLAKRRADFDAFYITAANRRVCASYPLPTVATVHDLANVHVKGKYSPLRMLYLARILPRFVRRADRFVAVSAATAADMAAHWRIPKVRIDVVYNGLTPLAEPPAGRPSWLAANGLKKGGYVLYVSRIEHPGKNHVALIEAFERLNAERPRDLDLVIAGSDWKNAEAVHARAASSPCAARIRFTGFLPDEDLAEAYRGAALYVFPSRFEGFGLSLIEAMAEGTPCACSANGALGEIAGPAATFDPDDVAAMAAAMRTVLDEPAAARESRVAKGRAHAATFSWSAHAAKVAGILEGLRQRRASATELFGIPIARLTQAEFAERMVAFAKGPRDQPKLVATLNVDFVANAVSGWGFSGNEELHDYLRRADLVTADGMPIVLLSRLVGEPLPARVTGSDLVPDLARRFAEEGLSFYVLGGAEPALTEALDILRKTAPNLKVAGTDTSRVPLEDGPETDAIIDRINAAKPDLLFVALGNPRQEIWAGRFASRLRVPALVGVGGSFNFIAGRVLRAPRWMQRAGLEWVWRVAVEPRRLWKRYLYGFFKFSVLSAVEFAKKVFFPDLRQVFAPWLVFVVLIFLDKLALLASYPIDLDLPWASRAFVTSLFWAMLVVAPYPLLGRWARHLYRPLALILLFSDALQAHMLLNYGHLLGGDWIELVMSSSASETLTYVKSCLTPALMLCLVGFLASIALLVVLFRRRPPCPRSFLCAAFLFVVGAAFFAVKEPALSRRPLELVRSNLAIGNFLVGTCERGRMARDLLAMREAPQIGGAPRLAGPGSVGVFVLGESATRNRWGLYGYGRPTTPAMSAIASELVVFSNMVASSYLTGEVMRLLMTEATLDHPGDMRCTLVQALARAGYSCSFFSTQDHWGSYGGMEPFLFAGCRPVKWHLDRSDGRVVYDDALLADVAQELARPDPRPKVVFLHLYGSHFPTHEKVPKGFDPFGGESVVFGEYRTPSRNVNNYDNTIAFTDRILGEIVSMLKARGGSSWMMYLSDHGESVDSPHYRMVGDPSIWEIPMILWTSPDYKAAHADLMREAARLSDAPLQNDRLLATVLRLCDVVGYESGRPETSFEASPFGYREIRRICDGAKIYLRK